MVITKARPSGRESPMDENEIIVTKTDLKGRITYANDVFLRVSHLRPDEAIGQPHNIIRHPDMPRAIFKLLWERLEAREEVFAYVVNLAANGDHYWVIAHVTPSYDGAGNVVGYHSMRRKPDAQQVARIKPLYRELLEEEARPANRKEGMERGYARLFDILNAKGLSYDRFVLSL